MFCKYCGKEAGENDVCADCKKTISDFMTHSATNTENINVTAAPPPEPYDANALVGFRTGKTWKKLCRFFTISLLFSLLRMNLRQQAGSPLWICFYGHLTCHV